MRIKDDILDQIEEAYSKTSDKTERMIINCNLLLEVLIDVRDQLKDLVTQVADFNRSFGNKEDQQERQL